MDAVHLPDENKNELYPVFLVLKNFELLIVGGGNVALEKLHSILSNSRNANITLVAPLIKQEIRNLLSTNPEIKLIERKFSPDDLMNKSLIICATDDKELHKTIKMLCTAKHQLVNVADTPELCDFYLASIVQKGNLKIAISTNGLSPTGAKRIKESLNDALPDSIDKILKDLNLIRNNLKDDFAYKIKKMNEVTALMGLSHQEIKKKKRFQLLVFLFLILLSLLLGYIIGTN